MAETSMKLPETAKPAIEEAETPPASELNSDVVEEILNAPDSIDGDNTPGVGADNNISENSRPDEAQDGQAGTNTEPSRAGVSESLGDNLDTNSSQDFTLREDARSPESPGAKMRASATINVVDEQIIRNIKVKVQAILGGISMSVSKLAELKHGELVSLDTKIGDAIDIIANDQLIARGEIVVIEESTPRFGITITEIL